MIYLYDAYEKVTVNEMNKLKPGLALNLYDVLTNAANTLTYHHYENGKDYAKSETEKFLYLLVETRRTILEVLDIN